METMGQPKFRARQLYGWIYQKGVKQFDDMHNIAKDLRQALMRTHHLNRPGVTADQLSTDGTRKFLLTFQDGKAAEMVFIPESDRGTLCISSQVGCTLTCKFCHTGTQLFVRNLEVGEIIGQLMLARDLLDDWQTPTDKRRTITNIVFMGMGEPLFNTNHVIAAVKLLTDGHGIGLTRRRVTVSTSGVVPDIVKLGEESGAALAVSLHAAHDELRSRLVPINRRYPLHDLMAALKAYPGLSNARRITFEYIMLDGVNDKDGDAKALARLIAGIPAKINLIPFNPWPGSDFMPSPDARMEKFSHILSKAGFTVTIRKTRGQDILAACGQLKTQSMRLSRHERRAIDTLRDNKEAALGL